MARKGLGKGLDSLIPDFYNEDFDSNSPQSLEDMLNEGSPDEKEDSNDSNEEVEDSKKEENIFDQIEKEREEAEKADEESTEELSNDEKAIQALTAAIKYKNNQQFNEALTEYQKIPTFTNDPYIVLFNKNVVRFRC